MKNTILIIFFLISGYTYACDCYWGGNFINSSKFSELVIKGKVIDVFYNFEDGKKINILNEGEFNEYAFIKNQNFFKSMKVEIIELIKGKEKKRIIEIFGSNGYDCRAGIHDFQKGGVYIFSMSNTRKSEYNQPNEDENDYHINGCSENTLQFITETNQVYGFIKGKSRDKMRNYSYEKLKRKISRQNN